MALRDELFLAPSLDFETFEIRKARTVARVELTAEQRADFLEKYASDKAEMPTLDVLRKAHPQIAIWTIYELGPDGEPDMSKPVFLAGDEARILKSFGSRKLQNHCERVFTLSGLTKESEKN